MANLNTIINATHYTDLFPDNLDEKAAEKRYLRLQRIAHPDTNPDDQTTAEQAFINLTRIWETRPFTNKRKAKQAAANTIKTKKHEYLFDKKLFTTHDITYYKATYDAGHKTGLIAISKTPQKNAAFLDGIRVLTKIRKEANPDIAGFIPATTDVFNFVNRGETLNAALLEFPEPIQNFYTLPQILTAYPKKLHPKDATWMYKRMLIALQSTHEAGYVHGNVNLNSFLIHPERHGLVLLDWNNVTEAGKLLKEIPSPLPAFLKNSAADFKMDIAAAAETAMKICSQKIDPQFYRALKGTSEYPPNNVHVALQELNELNRSIWGEPKWHNFTMPTQMN